MISPFPKDGAHVKLGTKEYLLNRLWKIVRVSLIPKDKTIGDGFKAAEMITDLMLWKRSDNTPEAAGNSVAEWLKDEGKTANC